MFSIIQYIFQLVWLLPRNMVGFSGEAEEDETWFDEQNHHFVFVPASVVEVTKQN